MVKVLTSFSIDHVKILLEGNCCNAMWQACNVGNPWSLPCPRPRVGTPWTMSDKIVSVIRHMARYIKYHVSSRTLVESKSFKSIECDTKWILCPLSYVEPGGSTQRSFFYGESSSRVLTPYTFIYHFWQKRHPFRIPSVELCITFNCCRCSLFQTWINLSLEHLDSFTALKCIC